MALTNFASLTTEQKTVWAKDFWKVVRNNSFIMQFAGKGHNALVQRITNLTKSEKGTRAVLTLIADLANDGITGDYILEGNEEAMKAYDTVINIDQLRNAVRNEGRLAEQKSVVTFREAAKDRLGYWMADKLDEIAFLTMSSLPYTVRTNGATRPVLATGQNLSDLEYALAAPAPTANRCVYVNSTGDITSGTGYDAADGSLGTLTYKTILRLKAKAKDEYMRGVRTSGNGEVFHMFVTPQGMADLKLDADFIANVRHAGVRGDKNSLFAGTDSVMVDGVVIHEFRHVFTNTAAAVGARFGATTGNDNGQRALFCGAQALGMADIGTPYWDEDYFDYNNQPGISIGKMVGFLKPQFKGNPLRPDSLEDFGIITVDTAI
jgi:N4-gp56 family major capsid protein